MNNDYFQEGIQEILRQALEGNPDMSQETNIGVAPEQTLEQTIISKMLDIRSLDIKGSFSISSNNVIIPQQIHLKGTKLTREGYPINFENVYNYTMADGTSLGEYCECLTCHQTVNKTSISRCPVCGKTVCVLCRKRSKSGKDYCCSWHKFLGGE